MQTYIAKAPDSNVMLVGYMDVIYALQYLRALAAIAVLIFHEAEDGEHWFNIGAAGVDLFFVMSGFIMYTVTEVREREPAIFLKRRLKRIVPLYWFATFVVVLLCWIHPHLLWGADISAIHVLTSLFFIPRVNAFGLTGPTVLAGWTLNIEFFFYIVVTAALLFPRRVQLKLMSVFLVSIVVAGLAFSPDSAVWRMYTNILLLEFVAGLIVGWVWSLDGRGAYAAGKLGSGGGRLLLCIGFSAFAIEQFINVSSSSITLLRPLYFGLPSLCLITGALILEARGQVPRVPFLKMLGDASYSVYLLHGIPQAIVDRLPLPFLPKTSIAIVSSVAVGVVAFYWIERPLSKWIRHGLP